MRDIGTLLPYLLIGLSKQEPPIISELAKNREEILPIDRSGFQKTFKLFEREGEQEEKISQIPLIHLCIGKLRPTNQRANREIFCSEFLSPSPSKELPNQDPWEICALYQLFGRRLEENKGAPGKGFSELGEMKENESTF